MIGQLDPQQVERGRVPCIVQSAGHVFHPHVPRCVGQPTHGHGGREAAGPQHRRQLPPHHSSRQHLPRCGPPCQSVARARCRRRKHPTHRAERVSSLCDTAGHGVYCRVHVRHHRHAHRFTSLDPNTPPLSPPPAPVPLFIALSPGTRCLTTAC